MVIDTITSVIVGGIITIAVAIFVEYYKGAVIKIIGPAYEEIQNGAIRSYRVIVTNRLPRILPFLSRNPAFQCEGEVTFHHLDGQNIYGRTMKARWPESPEPIIHVTEQRTGKKYDVIDPSRLISKIDIYPGEEMPLDIIAKFDNEIEAYGWSNESYSKGWRNENWKLKEGRYLVRVIIKSSGKSAEEIFLFVNDVGAKDCRLENAQKQDRVW